MGEFIDLTGQILDDNNSFKSLAEFCRIYGKKYNVHPDTINHVIRRIIWKDI